MTLSEFAHKVANRFVISQPAHMSETELIELVTLSGLCLVEDDNMLKVCTTYDPETCIIAFTRSFLDTADEQTIIRIVGTCKALDLAMSARLSVIRGGKE